jgi:uncharacterized protein (DUF1697 family)
MAVVVLLRGVNVGGHRTFQPSKLAKALANLDVVNVGAAGTFVVRKNVGQKTVRTEFLKKLAFDAEMMICLARELVALARSEPFPDDPSVSDARRYVSVMAKRPRELPPLPLDQPLGDQWQVKILDVSGRFALSLNRRIGRTLVYPNEVVEKKFGVAATTRNWDTVLAISDILQGGTP